ncbi:glycosyltransferase [Methylophilaceae bacterium]|nr:glycosyltransferase [Methylophilaceae bacterium]
MVNHLVSIIIPYYNHKDYIEELLTSIQTQTYKNIETILINDGSTDESLPLLKSLKTKYNFELFTTKNQGVCKTINQGLKKIKGTYVIIIASDDLLANNRIASQVNILDTQPYDAIGGGMTLMASDSKKLNYLRPRKIGVLTFADALFNNPVYAPSMMFRAATFKSYGPYDASSPIEDYSMLLSLLSQGATIVNFDHNWAYYRTSQEDYMQKATWYFEGIMATLSNYKNKPRVAQAKNYHTYLFMLRKAIFNGMADRQAFKLLFKNDELFVVRLLRYISLIFLALLPQCIRKIMRKMIIGKSFYLIYLTNLIRS